MADPAHVPHYLISLRPSGQHDTMRRAAARSGLRLLAVSPWRLQARDDPDTRRALAAALAAPVRVFTSPMAVRSAAALATLADGAQRRPWLAVGEGTAGALRRAGVRSVQTPSRMDSEGLLGLPVLAAAEHVGLVTAPGGRGLLAAALAERGVAVTRADVYQRVPQRLPPSVL
ncbi:MAG TPA: uroporphyrinogen-III synthase, partial [Stenotrophomonas sp.]|nr:uroporphyrinogen-III synthase [Stenotrophomonas sp.]